MSGFLGQGFLGVDFEGNHRPTSLNVTGVATITFGGLSIVATSKKTIIGHATISFGPLSISATSKKTVLGSASVLFGNLSITAATTATITGTVNITFGGLDIAVVIPPPPRPEHGIAGSPARGKLVRVFRTDSYANGEAAHFQRQLVKRPWQR